MYQNAVNVHKKIANLNSLTTEYQVKSLAIATVIVFVPMKYFNV